MVNARGLSTARPDDLDAFLRGSRAGDELRGHAAWLWGAAAAELPPP
jgi:hypothetical protein